MTSFDAKTDSKSIIIIINIIYGWLWSSLGGVVLSRPCIAEGLADRQGGCAVEDNSQVIQRKVVAWLFIVHLKLEGLLTL